MKTKLFILSLVIIALISCDYQKNKNIDVTNEVEEKAEDNKSNQGQVNSDKNNSSESIKDYFYPENIQTKIISTFVPEFESTRHIDFIFNKDENPNGITYETHALKGAHGPKTYHKYNIQNDYIQQGEYSFYNPLNNSVEIDNSSDIILKLPQKGRTVNWHNIQVDDETGEKYIIHMAAQLVDLHIIIDGNDKIIEVIKVKKKEQFPEEDGIANVYHSTEYWGKGVGMILQIYDKMESINSIGEIIKSDYKSPKPAGTVELYNTRLGSLKYKEEQNTEQRATTEKSEQLITPNVIRTNTEETYSERLNKAEKFWNTLPWDEISNHLNACKYRSIIAEKYHIWFNLSDTDSDAFYLTNPEDIAGRYYLAGRSMENFRYLKKSDFDKWANSNGVPITALDPRTTISPQWYKRHSYEECIGILKYGVESEDADEIGKTLKRRVEDNVYYEEEIIEVVERFHNLGYLSKVTDKEIKKFFEKKLMTQ